MSNSYPDIFSERDFEYAQGYARAEHESFLSLQVTSIETLDTPELRMLHEKVWPLAKKRFLSETLLPSWNLMTINKNIKEKSFPVLHDSACTYAVTIPLYQNFGWDMLIGQQEKEYSLTENEGVFYRGNDEYVLRGDFPYPSTNVVVEAHFFFVEPEHWWFTPQEPEGLYGLDYLYRVIRAPK